MPLTLHVVAEDGTAPPLIKVSNQSLVRAVVDAALNEIELDANREPDETIRLIQRVNAAQLRSRISHHMTKRTGRTNRRKPICSAAFKPRRKAAQ